MDPLNDESETSTSTAGAERLDLRIGPYRALKELGRGGMGRVYLAARADEQYQKRVAIKVIKADVDRNEVVSRFRRERQILASLDHPNISRFLDGGATEDGRPYVVMEYVEGKAIDQYCDLQKLSIPERLKLFRKLCSAVEYAHRNLIVHRDIKPGNILVTGEGVPKLLDFGIAKLVNPGLSGEGATMTGLAMTPEYASPEQARGEAVTTVSDVYSLGVLLYLLLTGHLPYRFKTRQAMDILRAVCEDEPEKPSTAAGRTEDTGGGRLTAEEVSRTREASPEQLRRRLSGDLDTILLMALRKEPSRRYPSVEALSEDLRRYLEGLPIKARKATFSYRTGKFLRRNWAGVSGAALVTLLIVGFSVNTVVQSRRLRTERDKAARVSSFLVDLFKVSNPSEARGNTVTAREMLDKGAERIRGELKDEPEVRATLMDTMGSVYDDLGLYDQAEGLLRESLEIRKRVLGNENPDVAASLHDLAKVLYRKNNYDEAEGRYREALAMRRKVLGNEHPDVAETLNFLALVIDEKGDYDGAETLLREALAMRRKLFGNEHPDVAMTLNGLAGVLDDKGDYAAAEGLDRDALGMLRRVVGNEHPDVPYTLNILGEVSSHEGKFAEAEKAFRESLEIGRKILPPDHIYIFTALVGLGHALAAQGEDLEAEPMLRGGIEIGRKILPKDASDLIEAESALGGCLTRLRKFDEAESLLLESYPILMAKRSAGAATREARQHLVDLYTSWGKLEKAREYAAVPARVGNR
jgi:serine/threonine protein kinase/tetratricopeptide (TPR) repeat protein